MNCAFDKEKLTGYYDGELDAAEKAEVERHIASCSECLRELGELKSAAILVKELPRLRAPRSIAEGVSREIQAAGKVHSFAKARRTVLWASAAAAALFVGLNIMFFSAAEKAPSGPMAASTPPPVAKIPMEPKEESLKAAGEKEATAGRRASVDRAQVDESKQREARKNVLDQQKEQEHARDDAAKKVAEAAPAERARVKEKADGLAKSVPEPKPAAEPMAPPKPTTAAPPGAAPAPAAAKPAALAAPIPEAAEKSAPKKDAENLARLESKRGAGLDQAAGAEAAPTHLTFAATQMSKSRAQLDEALRKVGAPVPPPAPPVKNMTKAPALRETETTISLELTDSQIARLRQELNKPGSSKLVVAAPGDPVLAEFQDGRMFGKKESAAVASGGAAAPQGGKGKELGKADAKEFAAPKDNNKDGLEGKDADAATRALQAADKSGEPRRKVVLHLLEVPYIPDAQAAPESLKK